MSLLVFMSVAALVSAFVLASRRAGPPRPSGCGDEAHTLASLVGVGGPDPMGADRGPPALDAFDLDGVAVFRVDPAGSGSTVVEADRGRPPARDDRRRLLSTAPSGATSCSPPPGGH